MRLRGIPIAASIALLTVAVLGGPAAAADGEVVLGSSATHPQVIEDPAAGACESIARFSGSAVDNLTDAVVELHGTSDCSRDPVAVLKPGGSHELSESTEVAAVRARS